MPKLLNKVNLPRYSSAPSTPSEADLYYNTTDDKIYVYTGSAWVEVGSGDAGADVYYQSSAPSSPSDGDIWIDSDDEVASVNSITDSTSTTSSTVAASATSVKSAYDLAASRVASVSGTGAVSSTGGTAPVISVASASTAVVGAVQLTDSTSSTSTTTAATPASVKSAYDLAGTAIPKNTVTAAGDILYASGSATVARLGIGTADQVLGVSAGIPAWTTIAAAGADVQEFTISGSWVKPSGKSAVYVFAVGGGAGGQGGAKQNINNVATGGNGGNGGAHNWQWFQAADLSGTVTVTIGAGGAGGTARTTNGWQTAASSGGTTTFGTYLTALGAEGAVAGTDQYGYSKLRTVYGRKEFDSGAAYSDTPRTVAGSATRDQDNLYDLNYMSKDLMQGGVGAYSQTTFGRPSADTLFGAAGGGAGGEKQSSNAANVGGAGGRGFGYTLDTAAAGGTANGGVGENAGTVGYGNGGAGGGAGSASVAGGAGGTGWLGGGGGGGGASQTGNSGAGGAGGGGWMLVISV
jgi:hypothetical protein